VRAAIPLVVAAAALGGCAATVPRPSLTDLTAQVERTERAFARTMRDRDFAGFTAFLSDEAVFLPAAGALRGKPAVAAAWRRYFDTPAAPFSWEPDRVQVLGSGTLAISMGPVRDPGGKLVGRFSSIWRLEAPGVWRIVFDHGCDVCTACAP